MADSFQQDSFKADSFQPDPKPRTWLDDVVNFGKGIASGGWGQLSPVQMIKGTVSSVAHPVDTFNNLSAGYQDIRKKAEDAFKRGDYAEGVQHSLAYILPLIGPMADQAGEKIATGTPREAGEGVGALAGATVVPKAAADAAGALLPKRLPVLPKVTNPNPIEAAAMDYVQGEGIPVSAAARTGNSYVRGVQKMADTTPLGTAVATRAERATTEGLRDLSGRLANRANPAPVVPEQAGEAVQGALSSKAAQHAANAETSYSTFRDIEQQPSSLRTVQTGTKKITGVDPNTYQPVTQTVPVTEQVPMPVDVKGIKTGLQPIYDDMVRWMEPAKRNASAGFQAIKSILDGPDVIPASRAEAGLGGLKELGRDGSGRNAGIAKFITPRLQDAIDQAVQSIDPQALRELQAGRAETAAQYGTKAVLDQLRQEPVQAFGQMTYAKDAGIDLLRQVEKEAPAELPKVGRAYLEDLFGKAQGEGGFGHSQSIWQKWQSLGPETKKILFRNPLLVEDLDKFFLAAKKIAENPNPSGSGVISWIAAQGMYVVKDPVTGIPMMLGAGALSKMLHSPAGVTALTKGLSIPLKAPAAAATAAQILKLAGDDVKPMTQLPKAAQSIDPSEQIGPAGTLLFPR